VQWQSDQSRLSGVLIDGGDLVGLALRRRAVCIWSDVYIAIGDYQLVGSIILIRLHDDTDAAAVVYPVASYGE